VYWWLESSLTPLLEGDPDIAEILPFHRHRWSSPRHWDEVWASVREIRAHRFDWVLDLQSLARSGILAWLANGGLTVGLDDSREGAPGFYDVAVPRPGPLTHAVDWYLATLPPLGVPVHRDFVWLPERPAVISAIHEKWDVAGTRWIALQPGARWENKRWPAGHFARLVCLCASELPGIHFAILGSASERELGDQIARSAPGRCLNLAGGLSLAEMVEWLRLSDALISNDTGPMHVAAALGRPVLALFGPTEPRRTGPYGQLEHVIRHPLPCAPCMKDSCSYSKPFECLRAIQPEEVARRLLLRLVQTPRASMNLGSR